jgi:hypothetical protein
VEQSPIHVSALEQFSATVEAAKVDAADEEFGEPDPEDVRNTMLYLLNEYATHLREQLSGRT